MENTWRTHQRHCRHPQVRLTHRAATPQRGRAPLLTDKESEAERRTLSWRHRVGKERRWALVLAWALNPSHP